MKSLPIFSLIAAFALVSCNESKTAKKLADDEELVALRERLEELNKDLESEEGDRAMLIAKYEVAIDSLENSVKQLNAKLESAGSEKMAAEVEAAPVSAKPEQPEEVEISMDEIMSIRAAAVGETFDELRLSMGRVYYDVRITGVDEIGVRFTHRNGAARIDFMNLPMAWKERFHFDIERFVQAQKAERIARQNWEKAVNDRLARIREEKREEADKAEQRS